MPVRETGFDEYDPDQWDTNGYKYSDHASRGYKIQDLEKSYDVLFIIIGIIIICIPAMVHANQSSVTWASNYTSAESISCLVVGILLILANAAAITTTFLNVKGLKSEQEKYKLEKERSRIRKQPRELAMPRGY